MCLDWLSSGTELQRMSLEGKTDGWLFLLFNEQLLESLLITYSIYALFLTHGLLNYPKSKIIVYFYYPCWNFIKNGRFSNDGTWAFGMNNIQRL